MNRRMVRAVKVVQVTGTTWSVATDLNRDLAASRQAAVSQETIHGVQATYYANANTNTLVWYEHGQGFVVMTVLHCSGDTPTPLASMLRFARSLTVPH